MSRVAEVQVSASALRHNLAILRSLAPKGCGIVAVVKANAYGHGLSEVVQLLEPLVDAFQVDDLEELRELRKTSGARALVFGYVPREGMEEVLALRGEPCVYDTGRLEAIERAAARLGVAANVHLKVDALLGRQGVLPSELPGLLDALRQRKGIRVLTAYAHYANIEDTEDPTHAMKQEAVFDATFEMVRMAYPDVGRHLSATSGLLTREGKCGKNSLVRLGIGLYGLYPSGPLAARHASLDLRPVMRWTARLAQVKTLPPGHPVSYGLAYVTDRPTRIGIVPQGYADGYDRGLSGCGEVLVRGKRCPVLGRVAMNMFMVDLGAVPEAVPEDEVVLLGCQGGERIEAEEIAAKLGTINYEVVARVSPLVPRSIRD